MELKIVISLILTGIIYGGSIKSRVIGKVYLGQVVKIVRKNRNCTLIECSDNDF